MNLGEFMDERTTITRFERWWLWLLCAFATLDGIAGLLEKMPR